jgi:hypothetical protein
MPTIVHTMLVRVGSMVCSARVASASAGTASSGSGGSELSAGAGSDPPPLVCLRSWSPRSYS